MLYDRALGRGNENYTPHTQVIIVQDFEVPFGKGHHWGSNAGAITNSLLGGWRLSGVTTVLSGEPFAVGIGTYPTGYAFPSVGPNFPDKGAASPYTGAAHNRSQWFKGGLGGAFLLPVPNTFGNFGFNNLYGPSYVNQDLAAGKSLAIAEKYNFTLRADAFNVFNHTNLGLPDTTVTDTTAGKITSLAAGANMRRLQFTLRMDF